MDEKTTLEEIATLCGELVPLVDSLPDSPTKRVLEANIVSARSVATYAMSHSPKK